MPTCSPTPPWSGRCTRPPAPPALCTHRKLRRPPSPPPCPSLPPSLSPPPSAPCPLAQSWSLHASPALGKWQCRLLSAAQVHSPSGVASAARLSASDCCLRRSRRHPVCAVGSRSAPLCRNGGMRLVVPFGLSSRLHLGFPCRVGVSVVGTRDAPVSKCLRPLSISRHSQRPWRCPPEPLRKLSGCAVSCLVPGLARVRSGALCPAAPQGSPAPARASPAPAPVVAQPLSVVLKQVALLPPPSGHSKGGLFTLASLCAHPQGKWPPSLTPASPED